VRLDRFVRKLSCLKATHSKRPQAKPLRVLIVDDSATVRRRLNILLSEIPLLEVIADAKDGAEALAVIRGLKPDLVTLDIQMPKMNGLEVLTAMRHEGIACRVIVQAGTQGETYREKCL